MTNYPTKTCFILGLNNYQSLSVIRNLSKYNIFIIGFDSEEKSISTFSNCLNKFIQYNDENELLELLLHHGRKLKTPIPIIPTRDHHCIFIDKNKRALSKYFLFNWQKNRKIEEIINKKSMHKLAKDSGLDTPVTFFSENDDIEKNKSKLIYPSMVKPTFTKQNTKGIIVKSEKELLSALKDDIFNDGYIIQEIITGVETNIFVIGAYSDIEGNILTYSIGQTLRQNPVNFGVKTYLKVSDNKKILKLTKQFLKHIKYYGISDIEFKYSLKDNSYKFIEINPRVPSFNQFYCSQLIELPIVCYNELMGEKIYFNSESSQRKYKKIIWIDLFGDYKTFYDQYIIKKWIFIFIWFKDVFLANSHSCYNSKDIRPFLNILVKKMKNFF